MISFTVAAFCTTQPVSYFTGGPFFTGISCCLPFHSSFSWLQLQQFTSSARPVLLERRPLSNNDSCSGIHVAPFWQSWPSRRSSQSLASVTDVSVALWQLNNNIGGKSAHFCWLKDYSPHSTFHLKSPIGISNLATVSTTQQHGIWGWKFITTMLPA